MLYSHGSDEYVCRTERRGAGIKLAWPILVSDAQVTLGKPFLFPAVSCLRTEGIRTDGL